MTRTEFANARALEDSSNGAVARRPQLSHLVLPCSAINHVDTSALERAEAIEHRLRDAGIALHLSDVKGPLVDGLSATGFIRHLNGKIFLRRMNGQGDAPGSRVG